MTDVFTNMGNCSNGNRGRDCAYRDWCHCDFLGAVPSSMGWVMSEHEPKSYAEWSGHEMDMSDARHNLHDLVHMSHKDNPMIRNLMIESFNFVFARLEHLEKLVVHQKRDAHIQDLLWCPETNWGDR